MSNYEKNLDKNRIEQLLQELGARLNALGLHNTLDCLMNWKSKKLRGSSIQLGLLAPKNSGLKTSPTAPDSYAVMPVKVFLAAAPNLTEGSVFVRTTPSAR